MPLHRFTRPLRSLLVKLHPYVSCCASCGEIKVPLEGRLCTSLAPAFSVDGVLLEASPEEAAAVRLKMPWLRHVHAANSSFLRPGKGLTPGDLSDPTGPVELAEHFFIAVADSRLERIRMILDLFTPNGMPLLAVSAAGRKLPAAEAAWCAFLEERGFLSGREASFVSDIYPMTRECLEGFTPLYGEFLAQNEGAGEKTAVSGSRPELVAALARWAYASAKAVPAGPLHPLSARGPS